MFPFFGDLSLLLSEDSMILWLLGEKSSETQSLDPSQGEVGTECVWGKGSSRVYTNDETGMKN